MTRYPICFWCHNEVQEDPIYEALCGHDDCVSAVWHALCLMSWRDHREEALKMVRKFVSDHPEFNPWES